MDPIICEREAGQRSGQTRLRLSAGPHRIRAVWTHRGVGGLLLLLVGDGRVHVDQTQEVQTQRRRQAAEQPAGSKVTVVTCSSCGAVGTSAPHEQLLHQTQQTAQFEISK